MKAEATSRLEFPTQMEVAGDRHGAIGRAALVQDEVGDERDGKQRGDDLRGGGGDD